MIALIAAVSKNGIIGNKGRIPWKIKGEQKRFKELTWGNVVVMGRRSYEEIGKPLPGRTTIVVSNTLELNEENCFTAGSLLEAVKLAGQRDVYISGGYGLYREALLLAEKLYLTEIDMEIEGDTYFPYFDKHLFRKEINEVVDGEIPYAYVTYTRN